MVEKLRQVYDNNNFITAVYAEVYDNEDDQNKIIDFINNGEEVTEETVVVLAMELADARE